MSGNNDKLLNDLFIVPDFENAKITVRATSPAGCAKINWTVQNREGKDAARGETAPSGKQIVFEAALPDFVPWNVNTPYLYCLVLRLDVRGKTVEHRQHFGMRKFHVEGKQIFLNNRPVFIKGYIRGREAHEHPNLIGVSTEEYYAKNIRMAKKYGFNFVRFHSRVPPEEFFRAADRLGLLAHIEMRRYRGKYQKREEQDLSFYDTGAWKEVILRVRNHPSLMVYCIGNEVDNPGNNPRAKRVRDLIKELDPTRLFLDTCSRGEFDRTTVDIDVQHMSYFCPFGEHDNMFEDTQNVAIYGSVTGRAMIERDDDENPTRIIRREAVMPRPLIAHETGHYIAHHDLDALEKKFAQYRKYYQESLDETGRGYPENANQPWWINRLKELLKSKGLENDYAKMLTASRRFQFIWWKQVFESVRRSPVLSGFHFLQLADTERYENTNGILDCFDDPKYLKPEEFLAFNGDDVILAHLPRRTFFEKEWVQIPVYFSHYAASDFSRATLEWSLTGKENGKRLFSGTMDEFDLGTRGLHKLCTIEIRLPEVAKPAGLIFRLKLTPGGSESSVAVENQWNLWLFPDRPQSISPLRCTVFLRDVKLNRRYPQISQQKDPSVPEKLMIIHRFTDEVIRHLENGGDVLFLYRVEENRHRQAPKESLYLPSTRDRFKGTIWDRGHNLGGFIREHPALGDFPHDGFIDFQFYHLVEDCDKINLDDFPVPLEPIIQGVDKAVRDRYDVYKFGLSDLVPEYTQRKFAYLFELRVAKGRLLVSALNFTGLRNDVPETSCLFEQLMNYVVSDAFQPEVTISAEDFRNYLLEKGKAPRTKERMMTQYWQLDDAPLETKKFWREAEAYLREED